MLVNRKDAPSATTAQPPVKPPGESSPDLPPPQGHHPTPSPPLVVWAPFLVTPPQVTAPLAKAYPCEHHPQGPAGLPACLDVPHAPRGRMALWVEEQLCRWREVVPHSHSQSRQGPNKVDKVFIHGSGCGEPLTELSRPCPWISQSVSQEEEPPTWAFAPGGLTALLGGRGCTVLERTPGCLTRGLAQVRTSCCLVPRWPSGSTAG